MSFAFTQAARDQLPAIALTFQTVATTFVNVAFHNNDPETCKPGEVLWLHVIIGFLVAATLLQELIFPSRLLVAMRKRWNRTGTLLFYSLLGWIMLTWFGTFLPQPLSCWFDLSTKAKQSSFYIGKSLFFFGSTAIISLVIYLLNIVTGVEPTPVITLVAKIDPLGSPLAGAPPVHHSPTPPGSSELMAVISGGSGGSSGSLLEGEDEVAASPAKVPLKSAIDTAVGGTPTPDPSISFATFFQQTMESIREQIPPVALTLQTAINQVLTAAYPMSDALACDATERFWQTVALVLLVVVCNLSEALSLLSPTSLHRRLLYFSSMFPRTPIGKRHIIAWGTIAFWLFNNALLAEWLIGFSYKPIVCWVPGLDTEQGVTQFRVGHQIIFCGFAMLLGMVLVYVNGVIMMYGNNTARAQYAAKGSSLAIPSPAPTTCDQLSPVSSPHERTIAGPAAPVPPGTVEAPKPPAAAATAASLSPVDLGRSHSQLPAAAAPAMASPFPPVPPPLPPPPVAVKNGGLVASAPASRFAAATAGGAASPPGSTTSRKAPVSPPPRLSPPPPAPVGASSSLAILPGRHEQTGFLIKLRSPPLGSSRDCDGGGY